jgi:hypothetical protein
MQQKTIVKMKAATQPSFGRSLRIMDISLSGHADKSSRFRPGLIGLMMLLIASNVEI